MVVFKKIVLDDGYEYLDPDVFIDESNDKWFKTYVLAKACSDVLNYYIDNRPDAFGDAPYARLDGFLKGYLVGRGLEIDVKDKVWDITKGKRVVMRVEIPTLPKAYHEALRENRKVRQEVFGF